MRKYQNKVAFNYIMFCILKCVTIMTEILRIKNENVEKLLLQKQLNNKYHSSYPARKKPINLDKTAQKLLPGARN